MVGTHPLSFKPAELYVLFPQRHSLTVSVAVCNRLRLATCGTPANFTRPQNRTGLSVKAPLISTFDLY